MFNFIFMRHIENFVKLNSGINLLPFVKSESYRELTYIKLQMLTMCDIVPYTFLKYGEHFFKESLLISKLVLLEVFQDFSNCSNIGRS
jgi:hypothetical protein